MNDTSRLTSPPNKSPLFVTSNSTVNAGRCSHSDVDEPSAIGEATPCAHASAKSWSVPSGASTAEMTRFEYSKSV